MIFRAEERAENMNDALDECVDSLIRQIRKNKTRLEKKLRAVSFEDLLLPDVEEEKEFDLIREKTVALKPQSVEEAILQMNLLGHNFFAFRDEDNGGSFAVVYRRNNGGYGLIDDEE